MLPPRTHQISRNEVLCNRLANSGNPGDLDLYYALHEATEQLRLDALEIDTQRAAISHLRTQLALYQYEESV